MGKIKPLTLNLEQKDWKEFCNNLSTSETKNGKLVELIQEFNKTKKVKE